MEDEHEKTLLNHKNSFKEHNKNRRDYFDWWFRRTKGETIIYGHNDIPFQLMQIWSLWMIFRVEQECLIFGCTAGKCFFLLCVAFFNFPNFGSPELFVQAWEQIGFSTFSVDRKRLSGFVNFPQFFSAGYSRLRTTKISGTANNLTWDIGYWVELKFASTVLIYIKSPYVSP